MTAGIRVSVTQPSAVASMDTGLPFGLFRFFNMNSPFIFAGALPPVDPTLVTGSEKYADVDFSFPHFSPDQVTPASNSDGSP